MSLLLLAVAVVALSLFWFATYFGRRVWGERMRGPAARRAAKLTMGAAVVVAAGVIFVSNQLALDLAAELTYVGVAAGVLMVGAIASGVLWGRGSAHALQP